LTKINIFEKPRSFIFIYLIKGTALERALWGC